MKKSSLTPHSSKKEPLREKERVNMSGDTQQTLNVYKCKELLHDKLLSSGQKDLLKRLLQNRLVQSGWTYAMRAECIDYIKKKGVQHVNISHMVSDIQPMGRERCPINVRTEIADFLKEFAKQHVNIDETAIPPPESEISYANPEFGFQYQGRDVKPEPGLGSGPIVPDHQPTPSPNLTPVASIPRSLTPQSPIPILRPQKIQMKPEPESDDDDEEDDEDQQEEEEEELMDV